MERIRFIEHNGHRVLLVDCSDCTAEDIATIANQVPQFVTQELPGSVLLLADFTGAHLSREAMERIKVAAVFNRQHLKRSAWVLTNSSVKPIRDAVQTFAVREIPSFDSRNEALNFLVA